MEQDTVAKQVHLHHLSPTNAGIPVLRQLRELACDIADPLELAEAQAWRLRELTGQASGRFRMVAIAKLPKIELYRSNRLPVPGTALWTGRGWRIEINGRLPLPEQRFATLHELKHVIDHPVSHRLYRRPRLAIGMQECAADYFAACALLPETDLWAVARAGTSAESIAREYGTTVACLRQRFRDLGLTTPAEAQRDEVRS